MGSYSHLRLEICTRIKQKAPKEQVNSVLKSRTWPLSAVGPTHLALARGQKIPKTHEKKPSTCVCAAAWVIEGWQLGSINGAGNRQPGPFSLAHKDPGQTRVLSRPGPPGRPIWASSSRPVFWGLFFLAVPPRPVFLVWLSRPSCPVPACRESRPEKAGRDQPGPVGGPACRL